MKRDSALRKELPASFRIPYLAHVSPEVIRTLTGDYIQVLKLSGASFESADDDVLNNWHERLNVLWRNVASPNVALWTHLIRRRVHPQGEMPRLDGGFASNLIRKYFTRLANEVLMVNELYLSIVYRPVVGQASGLLSRMAAKQAPSVRAAEVHDALDGCEKLAQTLLTGLDRYDPQRLSIYPRAERSYSAVLEFLGGLINGAPVPVPLPRSPVREVLSTSRVIFGGESIEYRFLTHSRFAAILGIKEYATPSLIGMFNPLLSAPFEFTLTQSFAFMSRAAGQGLLQRQYNQMANAGDFAISQAEELKEALDALTANEFVMGDHHFSLQVLADDLKTLNDRLALARAILADTGLTTVREDLALEAAYWAQLPGNFALRPRKAPITSRNFCAKSSFHNFPTGRASGNHWGDALATLISSARSPYYFSLHASNARDPDGGSRTDTGHTFICGPTGAGKSVLIGFLVTLLSRQRTTQVIFDKDRGLEILVRALGGTYLSLRNGTPTGFNPLQLPPTPTHIEFLKIWLRSLARQGAPLTVREEVDLDHALKGTLALEPPARRLSRLIEFTDATHMEGIHARLAPWCASTSGDYAWVFDNESDELTSTLSTLTAEPTQHSRSAAVLGFDVTDFLDHPRTRGPVTLYLFHVIRQLLDGRRFVCWMDEFWKLLSDPAFESFAKDGPKTWRKLNGVMALATQSAGDVLDSPISRTIIEQTPTKIFYPNPDADEREYTQGFGLSEREFRLIKQQLEPGSRQFLVKQGHASVVCELDLKGFEPELKVLSGRAATVEQLTQLIALHGPDPAIWLPEFMRTA